MIEAINVTPNRVYNVQGNKVTFFQCGNNMFEIKLDLGNGDFYYAIFDGVEEKNPGCVSDETGMHIYEVPKEMLDTTGSVSIDLKKCKRIK